MRDRTRAGGDAGISEARPTRPMNWRAVPGPDHQDLDEPSMMLRPCPPWDTTSRVNAPNLSVGQRRHLRTHGVIAAIDVQQLAGGHGQVVRQERTCGSADRRFVLQTPPERCAILPYLFEIL